MVGGAAAALCNRSSWVVLLASLLSIAFVLGLVPSGNEWPVPMQSMQVPRLFGLVVAALFGALCVEVKNIKAVDLAMLGLAAGAMELALMSGSLNFALISAELAALFSILFVYTKDITKAPYVTALTVASFFFVSVAAALRGSTLYVLNPPFVLWGHNAYLSDIPPVLIMIAVSLKFFVIPFSPLLPRLYAANWGSEPLKGFILFVLGVGSFAYIGFLIPMSHTLALFVGCGMTVICAISAMSEKDQVRMLAKNALAGAGIVLLLISQGDVEAALLYFILVSLSHVGGLMLISKSVPCGWNIWVPLVVAYIPTAPLPPMPAFGVFASIFAGNNAWVSAVCALYLSSNLICLYFKLLNSTAFYKKKFLLVLPVLCVPTLLAFVLDFLPSVLAHGFVSAKRVEIDRIALSNILAALTGGAISLLFVWEVLLTKSQDIRHNCGIDLTLYRYLNFICTAMCKFFSNLAILVFDYTKRVRYNAGQFGRVVRMVGNDDDCVGDTSGAVALGVFLFLSVSLWALCVCSAVYGGYCFAISR